MMRQNTAMTTSLPSNSSRVYLLPQLYNKLMYKCTLEKPLRLARWEWKWTLRTRCHFFRPPNLQQSTICWSLTICFQSCSIFFGSCGMEGERLAGGGEVRVAEGVGVYHRIRVESAGLWWGRIYSQGAGLTPLMARRRGEPQDPIQVSSGMQMNREFHTWNYCQALTIPQNLRLWPTSFTRKAENQDCVRSWRWPFGRRKMWCSHGNR